MYFADEELQKWKLEDLRKYLLQRGVPIGNNSCKASLTEKVICAQKLDLQIQPSQGERQKEVLNAKHSKLSVDAVQISHPYNIKENWISESIVLKNIDEYAELNSAKKVLKKGKNLLFSGDIMSVTFNSITSSLKYCFVNGFAVPLARGNENLSSMWGLHS